MVRKYEILEAGTTVFPLIGLTGQPLTLIATERITNTDIAFSSFAHTDSNANPNPADSMLRCEAHYSAMLDGAAGEANSLFKALSYALNYSHRNMDQAVLLDVARRIYRKDPPFKSPHSKAHLEQLLLFLSDTQYSPLMKGAVSHAFILATQPFVSGNGRVARLFNLFLLIQGGYPIRRSLSEVIAANSEDYIQAVRSLFLPSQSGSLTSFVEYAFDVLGECLGGHPDVQTQAGVTAAPSAESSAFDDNTSSEPVHLPIINEMLNSRFEVSRKAAEVLEDFLRDGFQEFDYKLWMSRSGMTYSEFDKCRKSLAKRQLITNLTPGPGKNAQYRICIPDDYTEEETCNPLPAMTAEYFWAIVENMECSMSDRICKTAGIIRSMITDGISEFTRSDWIAYSNMSSLDFSACRIALLSKGLVSKVRSFGANNLTLYRFTLQGIRPGIRPDVSPPVIVELDIATFENQLKEMAASRSSVIRSAAAVITEMISEGSLEFTRDSWLKRTGMTEKEYNSCVSSMYTRNLMTRIGTTTNSTRHVISLYRLTWPCEARAPILNAKELSPPEKYRSLLERISPLAPISNLPDKVIALMNRTRDCFRAEEWASVNNLSIDEASYELNTLIQMGLIYRQTIRGETTHTFRFRDTDQLSLLIENEIHAPRHPENYGFWTNLALLEFSHSSTIRRGAAEFYRIIEESRAVFPPIYLRHRLKMSHQECRNFIRALQSRELISAIGGNTRMRRYVIDPIAFDK